MRSLTVSKHLFIKARITTWTLADLCRVLGVSRSDYYQWRAASRRLRAKLQADGHQVGRYALRSWLRASGQRALSTRPQRPRTTQTDPAAVVAENRLLGQPAPTRPNQV
ncbi:MAG: hypothetical protein EOO62_03575 [Hymenobacter sp.]|nr:MAG: hypothetical protein EOO62_03575 [Hymenobacter sp.]